MLGDEEEEVVGEEEVIGCKNSAGPGNGEERWDLCAQVQCKVI